MTASAVQPPDYHSYALIVAGGFLGSIAHFWITSVISTPAGTLLVNTLGSFLMGIFMYEAVAGGRFDRHARMFLGVGFLGAFTTFSGLAVIAAGLPLPAAACYVSATIFLGLSGIFLGRTIVAAWHRRH